MEKKYKAYLGDRCFHGHECLMSRPYANVQVTHVASPLHDPPGLEASPCCPTLHIGPFHPTIITTHYGVQNVTYLSERNRCFLSKQKAVRNWRISIIIAAPMYVCIVCALISMNRKGQQISLLCVEVRLSRRKATNCLEYIRWQGSSWLMIP
jgi:hypothetical protein